MYSLETIFGGFNSNTFCALGSIYSGRNLYVCLLVYFGSQCVFMEMKEHVAHCSSVAHRAVFVQHWSRTAQGNKKYQALRRRYLLAGSI